MTDVVIVSAARTPIGSFNGGLSSVPAARARQDRDHRPRSSAPRSSRGEVSEVILGQILAAGQGQNPARQASINAGLPKEVPAYGVNILCGSGLKSVALGYQAIQNGDSGIVVAGGQESMSQAPHAAYLRNGTKMGALEFLDTMLKDGLMDAFQGYHMGTTAENVAQKWQITREEQDHFAVALAEQGRGRDQGRPLQGRDHPGHDQDPQGRRGSSTPTSSRASAPPSSSMAKLRPAFNKEGTVTAGNASGINDGAAAAGADDGRRGQAARPRAARAHRVLGAGRRRSRDHGHRADPGLAQGAREGRLEEDDLDLVEANEAFAAQALAVNKDLGWDTDKVNVNGGAIALGHPIGASGARVLMTLLHEMKKRDAKKGLATLCIGGGMGIAMCVERD